MTPIHAMQVTIEPGCWTPTFRATCSDPAADCHYVCAEGCESWGPIVRNEAGAVMGHEADGGSGTHRMEHVEECNYVGFLDASDYVDELMEGEPIVFTVPAEFIFDGCDEVTWKAIANGGES